MDETQIDDESPLPARTAALSPSTYIDAFDQAADGMFLLRDGVCVACNDQLKKLVGRSAGELLGSNIFSVVSSRPPNDRVDIPDLEAILARAVTGASQRFDWEFLRPDDQFLIVDATTSCVRVAGKSLLLVVVRDVTESRETRKSLEKSSGEFRSIISNMLDTFYQTDIDGCLTRVSRAVTSLLGFQPENLIGLHVGELYIDHNSRERFLSALREKRGELVDFEIQLRRHDRRLVWVSLNARYRRDERGNVVGIEGTVRDIAERKRSESEMRKLSTMLDRMADSVIVTDRHGVVEYVNPAFELLTGYSKDEVMGSRRWLFRSESIDPKHYEWMWKTIGAGHVFNDLLVGRSKSGAPYYEDHTITPVKDDRGNITHFIATGKDVSKRMQSLGRIQYPASHDALTELPNRSVFTDRLSHALARSRDTDGIIAVLLIDIDRFKTINETLSKDVGDQALRALSERLSRCVRDSDTVARVGGDEFGVILELLPSADMVAPVVRKILNVLAQPFDVGGRSFEITTSIGISLYPNDGDDSETLIQNADVALYRAREQERHSFKFYSSEISVKAFERLSLEVNLRRALEKEEFLVFFQPQFNSVTNEIDAAEALLRWRHAELGLVSPADFIPILEDTDLVVPLGRWMIRQACNQAKAWRENGFAPFSIAVNLTASQFYAQGMIEHISAVLEETHVEGRWLELELHESVLTQNEKLAMTRCRQLLELGVLITLDNFGSGITSLANVQRFLVRKVKIDRSFVGDAAKNPANAAIVKAVIAMSKAFGVQSVAEGVESEKQRRFLVDCGCDLLQGFLFTPPRAPVELERLLRLRDDKPAG